MRWAHGSMGDRQLRAAKAYEKAIWVRSTGPGQARTGAVSYRWWTEQAGAGRQAVASADEGWWRGR